MTGYWFRHRAGFSFLLMVLIGCLAACFFVYPHVEQRAKLYNSQSIYRNNEIDFIVPEPSFSQVLEFPGNHGIDVVFPFYLTKTAITINGTSRTTTILLSDQFQYAERTMYNDKRLIEKSSVRYDNPILVDWQFCRDTSAKIGDTISISIGGQIIAYQVYAIYETNSIYDGGAIMAGISDEQRDKIQQNAQNNGYSGMYIIAGNYEACKAFLTEDYRPLGRLMTRESFPSDDQYEVHYNAIMSSGYANEITDFRVRENNLDNELNSIPLWIGVTFSLIIIIIFNYLMRIRNSERGFFSKICIPKGENVKPYYTKSFIFEIIVFIISYMVVMLCKISFSDIFIPRSAIDVDPIIVPAVVIIAEITSLIMNHRWVNTVIRDN